MNDTHKSTHDKSDSIAVRIPSILEPEWVEIESQKFLDEMALCPSNDVYD